MGLLGGIILAAVGGVVAFRYVPMSVTLKIGIACAVAYLLGYMGMNYIPV